MYILLFLAKNSKIFTKALQILLRLPEIIQKIPKMISKSYLKFF